MIDQTAALACVLFCPFIIAFGIACWALIQRKVVQPWPDYKAVRYVYHTSKV